MKRFVLSLDLQEVQDKRRALKTVSTLTGINELTIDMKAKTLTVIGAVDPVSVVSKLRKKNWHVGIISLGPVEEPEAKTEEEEKEEKKDEPKPDEAKENEPKDDEELKMEEIEKKEEEPIKDEEMKSEAELIMGRLMQYKQNYPPMNRYISVPHSIEEDPNACVIC